MLAAAPALPPVLVARSCCSLAEEADIASHPTVVADFCCFFCLGPSAFEDGDGTRTRLAGELRPAGSAVVAAESAVVAAAAAVLVVAVAVVVAAVSALPAASSSALTPFGPLFWRW